MSMFMTITVFIDHHPALQHLQPDEYKLVDSAYFATG